MVTDGRADFCQLSTGCCSGLQRKHTVSGVGVCGGGMPSEHQAFQRPAVESGEVRGGEGGPQEQLCLGAPGRSNKEFQWRVSLFQYTQTASCSGPPHQAFHSILQAMDRLGRGLRTWLPHMVISVTLP